jgi:hypothetical protein
VQGVPIKWTSKERKVTLKKKRVTTLKGAIMKKESEDKRKTFPNVSQQMGAEVHLLETKMKS